jgi:tetratricopeptide (TPR) repeat protein
VRAHELQPGAAAETRRELLLALGDAQLKAGNATAAQDTFVGAAAIARARRLPNLLARAALGLAEMIQFTFGQPATQQRLVGLLEDALAMLEQEDARDEQQLMRILAALAIALYWPPLTGWELVAQRRDQLSDRAVHLARQHGDDRSLALALHARCFARFGPDNLDERLALAPEIIRCAQQSGDHELVLEGRRWQLVNAAETGDITALGDIITAYRDLAGRLRQPLRQYWARIWAATYALLRGELADAEQHNTAALAVGQQLEGLDTAELQNGVAVQLLVLRREQGRAHELEPAIRAFVDAYPQIPGWRVALAWIRAQAGDRADAARLFADLAIEKFSGVPRDATWLTAMTILAEICALLGEEPSAAVLSELLAPYQDRCAVVTFGFAWLGSVAHYLGLLAATQGKLDVAASLFEQAIQVNRRAGARPWLARTQYNYARMLLTRGTAADREPGASLLAEARRTAEELGMRNIPGEAAER